MKNGKLMTLHEAARYLGVHPVTVSRYCKSNRLTYYLFGSRKRFKEEDLDKFLRVVPAETIKEVQNDPFKPC